MVLCFDVVPFSSLY